MVLFGFGSILAFWRANVGVGVVGRRGDTGRERGLESLVVDEYTFTDYLFLMCRDVVDARLFNAA